MNISAPIADVPEPSCFSSIFKKEKEMVSMDQGGDDPKEIARKIEQATRIVSNVSDATTYGRLVAWIDELRERLRRGHEGRRLNHVIRARARELWEQAGRPEGRNVEFWLQAEAEVLEAGGE